MAREPSSHVSEKSSIYEIQDRKVIAPRIPELARLPAWELRRPRQWDLLPSVVDRLLALIKADGGPA